MLADGLEYAVTNYQGSNSIRMSAVVMDQPICPSSCRPHVGNDTIKLTCETPYAIIVRETKLNASLIEWGPAFPAGHVVDCREHDHGCTSLLHVADDSCHIFSEIRHRHAGYHVIRSVSKNEKIRFKIDDICLVSLDRTRFGGFGISRTARRNSIPPDAFVDVFNRFLLAGIDKACDHVGIALLVALQPSSSPA